MSLAWAKSHEEAGQPWPGLENLLNVYTHTHTHTHTNWTSPSTCSTAGIFTGNKKGAENKVCFLYL